MEVIFLNGVRYSIEFLKMMLVIINIFNIRLKKKVNTYFAISLFGVAIISYWFDLSRYSILYAVLAFIVFELVLNKKRNIGYVILAYLGISIVDMLFGAICISLFEITMNQMQDEPMIMCIINSISLILISILSFFLRKNKRSRNERSMGMYTPIIILGGLFLSIYLTCTQLLGLDEEYLSYRDGFVFSAIVVTIIYLLICYLLVENHIKNRYLQKENGMNQRLLEAQNEYYSMLLKKETETKMFRHDIKEHIMCIQMLYEQKKYDELGDYLNQMRSYTGELSTKFSTGNVYVDMILLDLSEQFPDVELEWIGKIPQLSIASMDVCTLFMNLLKNAFESAHNIYEKSVKVIIKTQETNLVLVVSDYYDMLKQDENQKYVSTKEEKGHGYGIRNIERCVEKYNGLYVVTTEDQMFSTEIILPDVIVID